MAIAPLDELLSWIGWYGQSAIRIQYPAPEGAKVLWIDPHKIQVREKADLILITHPHGDHFEPESIDRLVGPDTQVLGPSEVADKRRGTQTLSVGQARDLGWVKIEGVAAYNIKKDNHPKSSGWLGYILTLGGRRIWHAGDTERIPEMKSFKADLAFVPLGQTYTMGSVEEAAEAALDSGAKLAVPIHYGMYEGSASDAAKFVAALKGKIRVEVLTQKR